MGLARAWIIVCGAGGLILGGCAGSRPSDNANAVINSVLARQVPSWDTFPRYVVEPPDELTVTVKDNPDLRTVAPVRPDGRISLPLVGDVLVAGKTVEEIEKALEADISRYIRNVDVTVSVTAFRSKHIFVYGEVQRPGAYPYTGRDTVVKAIALAGTLNWRAAPNDIQVTRGDPRNPTILPVRLKDVVIEDDDATNWYLQPNDIVWVPPTAMVKVGDVAREILWPIQWLVAPAAVYSVYDDMRDR